MRRSRPMAERAIELDPGLGAAHTSMAMIRMYADWDWERAEENFLRALEIDPGYVWGHLMYGMLLTSAGRVDEALAHAKRAHDLDPLAFDPSGQDLGRLYEWSGDAERAVDFWTKKIELAPTYYAGYLHLGDYLCRTGEPDKAIPLIERAIELNREDPWTTAVLAHCLAISGEEEAARRMLAELEALAKERYVTPVAMAMVHAGLDETDEAFDWLGRAFEMRSLRLINHAPQDPRFDRLRSDPRFDQLLRGIFARPGTAPGAARSTRES